MQLLKQLTNINMTYYNKLTKILGREPFKEGVKHHQQYFKFKTLDEAAKDLFNLELKDPKMKIKALKLGLL